MRGEPPVSPSASPFRAQQTVALNIPPSPRPPRADKRSPKQLKYQVLELQSQPQDTPGHVLAGSLQGRQLSSARGRLLVHARIHSSLDRDLECSHVL